MNKLIAYKDGNNNCWEIHEEFIQYKALTSLQSSSGNYNGGKDSIIEVSIEQFSQLQILAQAALNDSAEQLSKRNMGSALLIFEDREIILDMRAFKKKSLEDFLNNL